MDPCHLFYRKVGFGIFGEAFGCSSWILGLWSRILQIPGTVGVLLLQNGVTHRRAYSQDIAVKFIDGFCPKRICHSEEFFNIPS